VLAETIYIRADGSVDPPSASLTRDGKVYTLTDDVEAAENVKVAIRVERDGVTLEGAGHVVRGKGASTAWA